MVKEFICEVYNNDECEYIIEFRENNKVLESLKEYCLENCLIDLYDFERECYDKYCDTLDIVKIRINDLQFGL